MTMRRWNGWGDPSIEVALPGRSIELLDALVGPPLERPADAILDDVVAAAPPSRLTTDPMWTVEPEDRIRHARGQSLPDWIALRSGRLGPIPDAVARPMDDAETRALVRRCRTDGLHLVPYGGGTSVVGGVSTPATDRPVVVVDLGASGGLRHLDARSGLATFGAGTFGPAVEQALEPHGSTLGHFPQSFEWSTVGGWVAARSVGQESLAYGRMDELFAGGHVETPVGPLDLAPYPASAAGPDLRQVVLGSEGRLGIITDVIVRVSARPEVDVVRGYSIEDRDRAIETARALGRAGLPLSMIRLLSPAETATAIAMSSDERRRRWLMRYLRWRGQSASASFLLVGMAGRPSVVRAVEGEVGRIVRGGRGVGVPGIGAAWRRQRFSGAYLRNALWDAGYAVDTLETAATWEVVAPLADLLEPALREGLAGDGERVHAFSHMSHVYPSGSSLYATYVYRRSGDPDLDLARWQRLKTTASDLIAGHGGTISHQHGVGRDHRRHATAEKGEVGMAALRAVARSVDPDGVMSPGVLFEDVEP